MANNSDHPESSDANERIPLSVRAYQRCGGAIPLALAAIVGTILALTGSVWGAKLLGHCGHMQLSSQLAGSGQRFVWLTGDCPVSATPAAVLGTDLMFIGGFWLACTAVLISGWWRYEAPALRRASWVLWLPTAVALADLIEDGLLWLLLRASGRLGGGYRWELADLAFVDVHGDPPALLNSALLTVSWVKWLCAFAMVVAVALAAAVWFSRRNDPFPPPPVPRRHEDQSHDLDARHGGPSDPEMRTLLEWAATADAEGEEPASQGRSSRVGICLSGGGIRSTSFCLGVLSQLERTDAGPSPTSSARYLAAVSGGSWAATAWTLQKAHQPDEAAAERVIYGLKESAKPAGYQRQKYLLNSRGGILGALCWVVLSAATNLTLVALLVYTVAWPLGWFMSRCVIDSGRLGPERCGSAELGRAAPVIPVDHLYMPAAVLAVLGVGWLLACACFNKRGASLWPVGAVLLAMSLFSVVYLCWIPDLFARADSNDSTAGAAIGSALGGSLVVTFAAGVWKVVGGPLVKEVTGLLPRVLPRLLGFVLLAGLIAWALTVMYFVSRSRFPYIEGPVRWVSSWWAYLIPVALVLVMFALLGPNCPTLHNIFCARLRRSFDPVAHPLPRPAVSSQDHVHVAEAVPSGDRATWKWLQDRTVVDELPDSPDTAKGAGLVPELILCCAQQRNGLAKGGLRAETFTVGPRYVRQGADSYPTERYVNTAGHVRRFRGWSPEFGELDAVSTWLATSGAAFSSAMGRMSLGSTNAFLAAVNADLGIWLPNVKTLWQYDVAAGTERLTLEAEILNLQNTRRTLATGAVATGDPRDECQLAPNHGDFEQRMDKLRHYIGSQKLYLEAQVQRLQPHSTGASHATVLVHALDQHLEELAKAEATSTLSLDASAGTTTDDNRDPDVEKRIDAIDAEIVEKTNRLERLPAAQARRRLPRPRFAYILKEILGWYHSDDRYVFVTDGGHWDNLGLVELLRRGCDTIYCVDASGDPTGTFATLRESLQLAALELDYMTETIDVDDVFKDMLPHTDKALPAKIATSFTLQRDPVRTATRTDVAPAVATVYYTKLQSVQGMTDSLKRWAIADPKFPRYSTAQQFLRARQFANLVELGRFAGAALLALVGDQSGNAATPPNSQLVDAKRG